MRVATRSADEKTTLRAAPQIGLRYPWVMTIFRAIASATLMVAAACKPTTGLAPTVVSVPEPAPQAVAIECAVGTAMRSDSTAMWCERPDGVREGPYLARYPDGAVRTRGQHVDGLRDGDWLDLWADGRRRSIERYDRGKPTGTWITFFADGSHATESLHREDGSVALRSFRTDGTMARQGVIIEGVERGDWTEWDATGVATTIRRGDTGASKAAFAIHTGIPACDEYLAKFDRCIRDHMPEAARPQLVDAMAQTRKAWQESAAGPGRDQLGQACAAALEAARSATKSIGCEW